MSGNNDSDQNFNDAELQDIMSEIESLEKEFVDDEGPSDGPSNETETDEVTASAPEETTDVDDSSDSSDDIVSEADIESISQEMVSSNDTASEQEETGAVIDNVTELKSNSHSADAPAANGETGAMSFQGTGHLDFNLSFMVGSEQATLKIVDGQGFSVEMGGTTVHIDQTGCHVDVEGGASINLPTTSKTAQKKAA